MTEKKSKRLWITAGCILTGIVLMIYPFVSNLLYEKQQEKVIYQNQEIIAEMGDEQLKENREAAIQYNKELRDSRVVITDPFDPDAVKTSGNLSYPELLNVSGDGLMCYIEIPVISVFLPVYHGTTEQVLNDGVGHLENTSLPVGGEGTHAVLSAHSGLSDKKLFTDLELLETGDIFYIYVLNEILAYQVDQIKKVLPTDTDDLHIVSGEDYVTLVTCTPYGINSHRLLVRGTRIPYNPEEKEANTQTKTGSPWMRQYVKAVIAGLSVLVVLVGIGTVANRRRNREKR